MDDVQVYKLISDTAEKAASTARERVLELVKAQIDPISAQLTTLSQKFDKIADGPCGQGALHVQRIEAIEKAQGQPRATGGQIVISGLSGGAIAAFLLQLVIFFFSGTGMRGASNVGSPTNAVSIQIRN